MKAMTICVFGGTWGTECDQNYLTSFFPYEEANMFKLN